MLLYNFPQFSYVQLFLFFILGSAIYKIVEGFGTHLKAVNRHNDKVNWCTAVSLWQIFLFLAMFQYFLALENIITTPGTSVPLWSLILHIISVVTLTILATIITPNLNAPDVQKLMDEEGQYDMNEFFRRHRRTLALFGGIFLVSAVLNYAPIHPGEGSYLFSYMMWFHIAFLTIVVTMGLYGPADPKAEHPKYFTGIQRVLAITAIGFEIALIIIMVFF